MAGLQRTVWQFHGDMVQWRRKMDLQTGDMPLQREFALLRVL